MKTKRLLTVVCALIFALILSASTCLVSFANAASLEETEAETAIPVEPEIPEGEEVPEPEAPVEPEGPVMDDTLNVTARTLALKSNVYIKYAVPVGEATDVKMLFWTEAQEDYVIGTQDAEVDPAYQQTVEGVECNIFQYKEMADKQMTDVLYARAYAVVDGVYHYGEVNKYSILQYAYNKQNAETPDEALNEKLDAMLEKGAAAQVAADYKTDDLANEPHSSIHAVDTVLADGFKDFLHPDAKEVVGVDKYLKNSGAKTFYIEFGMTLTGYQTIESYIYYFEQDLGAKKDVEYDSHMFDKLGRIYADCEFVTIETNVYYFVSQQIVYNYYVILDQVYYFGIDGIMRTDVTVGDFYFGADGILVGDNIFFETEDYVYYIQNNVIIYIYIYIEGELYIEIDGAYYPTVDFDSTVFESDHDQDAANNDKLGGVTCKAVNEALGLTFIVVSDELGNFCFAHLPKVEFVFIFEIEGYITANITIDVAVQADMDTIILDKNVSNSLTGRVSIADTDNNMGNNASLAGATVEIERISSTNRFTATTTTDAQGYYSFGELTAGVYILIVRIDAYIIVNQTVYIYENVTVNQNAPIEMIPDVDRDVPGTAAGNIVDARTGRAVSGVTVYIRAGLNNTTGEILATVITNSNGSYSVEGLLPGNYTAQIVDERELDDETYRFGTLTIMIKVMAHVTITNQNATVSNSAGLDIDGMRVVLTWGSWPSDLDSHMQINLTSGASKHIYYSSKTGLNAALDVDDTSSYGPETITVSSIQDGTYRYYIYNFSGGNICGSGATVNIYFGASTSPAYTLYVPTTGSGRTWNVFTYDSVAGELTITNTIS